MYTAEDVKAGRGITRKKPYTSVLPYLRAQEAEKASQTQRKVEATVNKQDREARKTALKHIHPSATEAELEEMVDL